MEKIKQGIEYFEGFLSALKPLGHISLAFFSGVIAHLGLISSVFALFVLLLQVRVLLINSKIKQIELKRKINQYKKECG